MKKKCHADKKNNNSLFFTFAPTLFKVYGKQEYNDIGWCMVITISLLTWMQTSLKIFIISVNVSENGPIPQDSSSSLLFIYKYWYSAKKISKRLDTDNSNSSKMIADSSDFFQVILLDLSELFRLSHILSSLPDRHHRPHSKSKEHLRHPLPAMINHPSPPQSYKIGAFSPPLDIDSQIFHKNSVKNVAGTISDPEAFFTAISGLQGNSGATTANQQTEVSLVGHVDDDSIFVAF